jgi:hypothetical protein
MKKVRLTESDLVRIIEKVVKEEMDLPKKTGKLAKPKINYMGWRDENDYASEGPGEGVGSIVSYDDFMRFVEDHPDLADKYFGWAGERSGEVFKKYGGVDVYTPDSYAEDDFDFEDDFEFEDSELAEMKRKVRVMENKLRRKKQMRKR